MTYRLYRTPIPEDSLQSQDSTTQSELARLTQLQGAGEVTQLGTQAGDLTLDQQYRGRYADRLQLELQELIESPTIEAMPLAPVEGPSGLDGYYAVDRVDGSLAVPQSNQIANTRAVLVKEGTQNSHWQGVDTKITQPEPGHPFGNSTDALVGVPAEATHVRAVDAATNPTEREIPTPVETVEAEHGSVDLIDVGAIDIENPLLYYGLEYDLIGDVDPGVWDTYGHAEITDADEVVQWGRVFDQAHDFRGSAVLENGLLRLTITEPSDPTETGALEAERWGGYGAGEYGTQAYGESVWYEIDLPAEDWTPLDLDLIRIGQARVDAQLEFEATADTTDASAGDTYAVDLVLHRGYGDVKVWIPQSVSDPVPGDLGSLLDPVADGSVYASGAEQRLLARKEVRL